ncbi:hypothetical protein FNU76_15860 [Chitinimonas arctica]|uniref:IraD/Gp25-like domain-containing protein n=1 Tax=Chitinimonas arctica TaxID=2594795 RepID=A0A516SMJ3_9NEIS|nr:GPW/gp25 family protein [Chitinimonas arctica]QDQ29349.1 hypothetical protein FNU76_15860 [Chitinimonas arctica]
MHGMNARTGAPLGDLAHIEQSVADILLTPIGSRVMRRDYGSLLPELIDYPATPSYQQKLIAATAMAILRWEPRIRPSRVIVHTGGLDGRTSIELQATRQDGVFRGQAVALSVSLRGGA